MGNLNPIGKRAERAFTEQHSANADISDLSDANTQLITQISTDDDPRHPKDDKGPAAMHMPKKDISKPPNTDVINPSPPPGSEDPGYTPDTASTMDNETHPDATPKPACQRRWLLVLIAIILVALLGVLSFSIGLGITIKYCTDVTHTAKIYSNKTVPVLTAGHMINGNCHNSLQVEYSCTSSCGDLIKQEVEIYYTFCKRIVIKEKNESLSSNELPFQRSAATSILDNDQSVDNYFLKGSHATTTFTVSSVEENELYICYFTSEQHFNKFLYDSKRLEDENIPEICDKYTVPPNASNMTLSSNFAFKKSDYYYIGTAFTKPMTLQYNISVLRKYHDLSHFSKLRCILNDNLGCTIKLNFTSDPVLTHNTVCIDAFAVPPAASRKGFSQVEVVAVMGNNPVAIAVFVLLLLLLLVCVFAVIIVSFCYCKFGKHGHKVCARNQP